MNDLLKPAGQTGCGILERYTPGMRVRAVRGLGEIAPKFVSEGSLYAARIRQGSDVEEQRFEFGLDLLLAGLAALR